MHKLTLLFALVFILFAQNIQAIEESVFKIQGTDAVSVVLEKLGAPKGAKLPAEFNNKDSEIKVDQTTDKMLTVDFTPSHPITFSDADRFEKIEVKDQSDRINHALIIADPKSGRIFHLNGELKVSKMELVKPWTSKNLLSLKAILNDLGNQKIEKKK